MAGTKKFVHIWNRKNIDPNLSKSKRLSIIHVNGSRQYNLQIRHFSNEDEGLYKCIRRESSKDEFFTLNIGTRASNLTIEEEDSQHIVYGYLNRVLDLRCTVVHGIPNGKLMWMVHNQTLEEKQQHLPPIVSISLNKTLGIPEGVDLKLYCNYSSNHEVIELKWEKRFQHESPLDERSQYLNIKSINRQHAGKYRCTVINMAGRASDIVTIEVYYPPAVQVILDDRENNRELNCIAHGVPDHYIFTQWEHRSDYSDLIRYLPDDGIGKPYFVTSNNNTQYGIKGQQCSLTFDFVSFPDIENISVIVNDMLRSNEIHSIKTMKVMDRVYNKPVLVNGSRLMLTVCVKAESDFGSYTIKLYNKVGSAAFTIDLRQLRAPQNLKAVALDTQIIVKWTGNHNSGLQETFFVEYRKHFESLWSQVSAEYKSTAILNGLQPGAVYFLRVFSKTAAGESSRSDIIIVKTEKQHSKVTVFTVELAMILGVIFSMIVICWCGNKALTYKQRSSRIQNMYVFFIVGS
ncbi:unnamed protein product [Mytilus edulis]|uniref:Uncharacterized protein n=1 Tax=Mytilus edulis TaxID=6550 RepID=A0A8S3Q0R7_MYTED|nr:unnamed protein product [Mytilus edulis]